jgi:hypothetical protein
LTAHLADSVLVEEIEDVGFADGEDLDLAVVRE